MRLGQEVLRAVRWAARVLRRSTMISSVDEMHGVGCWWDSSSLDPASAVTWQLPGGPVDRSSVLPLQSDYSFLSLTR